MIGSEEKKVWQIEETARYVVEYEHLRECGVFARSCLSIQANSIICEHFWYKHSACVNGQRCRNLQLWMGPKTFLKELKAAAVEMGETQHMTVIHVPHQSKSYGWLERKSKSQPAYTQRHVENWSKGRRLCSLRPKHSFLAIKLDGMFAIHQRVTAHQNKCTIPNIKTGNVSSQKCTKSPLSGEKPPAHQKTWTDLVALAPDWQLQVDLGRQLKFLEHNATTTLRPDVVLTSDSSK